MIDGMGPCLDENTVLELCEGSLDAARAGAAGAHIDDCATCRRLVALVAGDGERAADAPLAPGATLGRHVILEAVGAGAMGFVYAAYDPELERKVALKLLRPDVSAATLRGRLLREARAMAQLSHPNVITVHDVGTFGDHVFIAMEFVDGGTLADWLRRAPRSWRAALDAFRQAGEGLAAAHAAGIVHRDFKPENVLVGGDGRVRVTDFGLARAGEAEARGGEAKADSAAAPTLTQRGALVGTPAYMAPEQLAGGPGTARSDQYAFCVALHEALHGARPSAGAPRRKRVPAWVDRVIERGLRAEPDARFPSMRALLDALAAGPPLGPRRVLAAAALAALIALAGSAALRPKAAPVCGGAAAAWGGVYGEAERGAVRGALARAGPSGKIVFTTVDRALDAYRGEWTRMHTSACEATRVRGEQSEAMLDRRMGCLADRRRAAAALTSVLARADAGELAGAADAAARLPSIDGCADARALALRVPPPEGAAQRAAVERAAGPIAEANALVELALPTRGLSVLAAAEAPARESGYAPIEARRLWVRGQLEYLAGALASAEATLHAAGIAAAATGDEGLLADVWTLLGRLVGFRRYRPDEGRRWLAYAEAALRRAGGDDEREVLRLHALAVVAWYAEGHDEEARALLSRARALLEQRCASVEPAERSGNPRCSKLLELDGDLAGLLSDVGHSAEAIPLFERVRAARALTHGPDARWVTLAMMNEGEALSLEGRPAEGLELLRRARALEVRAGRFVDEGFLRHRAADALRRLGRFEEALAEDRASLEAIRRAQGEESKPLAWPLTGEGEDLIALGRAREAIAPLERAVTLRQASTTAPTELGASRFALARALWDGGGDRARASTLAEEARRALAAAAARHGGWFRRALDEIERWLAAHPTKD
jgi:tetratricopeptide (TPR) repeat protein/predicted Ser/Thr protein kinase